MEKLTTESITVSYEEKTIEDISIKLNKGEIVSILGVSGVGKTTLFNVIAGLIKPDSGRCFGRERHYQYYRKYQLHAPKTSCFLIKP